MAQDTGKESVCLSRYVGRVANLPQLWQVGNLPHIAVYRIDGNPCRERQTVSKAPGRFLRLFGHAAARSTSCLLHGDERLPVAAHAVHVLLGGVKGSAAFEA